MWKQIESYINKNRGALDLEEPSPELWNKIERELESPSQPSSYYSFKNFPYWKVAAIILITIGLSYLGFYLQHKPNSDKLLTHMSPDSIRKMWGEKGNSSDSQDVSDLELFYTMQQNSYWNRITEYELYSYPFSQDYLFALEQLDEEEIKIKQDMEQNGFTPHFLEALIRINKQKLKVLEKLLQEVEEAELDDHPYDSDSTSSDIII